jgi:hypothetical protein
MRELENTISKLEKIPSSFYKVNIILISITKKEHTGKGKYRPITVKSTGTQIQNKKEN